MARLQKVADAVAIVLLQQRAHLLLHRFERHRDTFHASLSLITALHQ
jgi:hypothetical protein